MSLPAQTAASALSFHFFSTQQFMKKNRLLPIFLFVLAAVAGIYLFSCQREAETTDTKPFSNVPIGSRDPCMTPGLCNVAITADADVTLSLCGGIVSGVGSCSTGCNPSTDMGLSGFFPEDEMREFCVIPNARLCISTSPTSVTVNVTIQFGMSTPLTRTILPGQTICFHTNQDCDITDDDCN